MIEYSIIIPHKDVPDLLKRLMETWPATDDTEVIVVDDHSSEDTLREINHKVLMKDVRLVHVPDDRKGAGAARNVGLSLARGKWLIFADSDDFFVPEMKSVIDKYRASTADLIYFHTACQNTSTGEEGTRHHRFNAMLDAYTATPTVETLNALRYGFTPPWSKMIKRDYIVRNNIWYDEVRASNDLMFSILAAYYAKEIIVAPETIYCVTENTFGLTRTYNKEAWYARFDVALRANKFYREHGLSEHQYCIPMQSFKLSQYGFRDFCHIAGQLIKYRQNPFAGLARHMKEKKEERKSR